MKIIFAVMAFIALSSSPAFAAFRCPLSGKIASEGMNAYEVEAICGEPAAKTRLTTEAALTATPAIEEWTYDFGPDQLIRKLRFEGGIFKSESTGGYGMAKKKGLREQTAIGTLTGTQQ